MRENLCHPKRDQSFTHDPLAQCLRSQKVKSNYLDHFYLHIAASHTSYPDQQSRLLVAVDQMQSKQNQAMIHQTGHRHESHPNPH